MTKGTATGVRSTRRLLLTYLSAQIDELRSREPGARIDSPDAVHRMRVASRRLRSSLATFRPLFRGSKAQRLRDELQWLGTVLGPVRDVGVMRAHLQEAAAALVSDADLANVLAQLDHELAERHSRAHAELVTAMDGPRYAALLAALEAFVIQPPWATRVTKAAARLTMPALVGRACARVDRAARAARAARVALAGPVAQAARNVDGAPGPTVSSSMRYARRRSEPGMPPRWQARRRGPRPTRWPSGWRSCRQCSAVTRTASWSGR